VLSGVGVDTRLHVGYASSYHPRRVSPSRCAQRRSDHDRHGGTRMAQR
jgi:hypothetical protein